MRVDSLGARRFPFFFQTQSAANSARIARNEKRVTPQLVHKYQKTAPAGYYQPFKHPHVMRSPPIGITKLSEVLMNKYIDLTTCESLGSIGHQSREKITGIPTLVSARFAVS